MPPKFGFLAEPLAIVQPSSGRAGSSVIDPSAARLWAKHAALLPPADRARFAATLDVERAAARARDGHRFLAMLFVLRSLWRIPFGNQAVMRLIRRSIRRNPC